MCAFFFNNNFSMSNSFIHESIEIQTNDDWTETIPFEYNRPKKRILFIISKWRRSKTIWHKCKTWLKIYICMSVMFGLNAFYIRIQFGFAQFWYCFSLVLRFLFLSCLFCLPYMYIGGEKNNKTHENEIHSFVYLFTVYVMRVYISISKLDCVWVLREWVSMYRNSLAQMDFHSTYTCFLCVVVVCSIIFLFYVYFLRVSVDFCTYTLNTFDT